MTVLEPMKSDASETPEAKWRLWLDIAAIILFVVAVLSAWQLLALSSPQEHENGYVLHLVGVIGSLILMAGALMVESRLAERMVLRAAYHAQMDRITNSLNHNKIALSLVADRNQSALTVFDRRNRYWYVNNKAAQFLGIPRLGAEGQTPLALLPPDLARKVELQLAEVRAADQPIVKIDTLVDGISGKTRFIQRHFEVITETGDMNGFVVLQEDDLTTLIIAKERREQMLRQVIETLVAVVDRRDPYASGHSSRVGQLSKAIAVEMGLEPVMVETAEIAGSLMNFGKVLVSRRILTKTTALDPEELQRVRDSILTSADILAIISFEGPVVPTLRQVLERFDGTGSPDGLKGEEILVTARIVAVANAFVAFVSPRAHREGLSFREALAAMLKDSGRLYDEKVLVALTHYIENRPNKLDWLTVTKQALAQ